jgi:3-oxoacyl-[acyl-carrier-protein] synthase-3
MTSGSIPVGFEGLGTCVPERIMTNQDLERMVDTTDEWITLRTGIRERRILDEGQSNSDIAAEAARSALADAGLQADDLDLIICCTFTPDHPMPATACIIQQKLGMRKPVPAFDLGAACSGFIYGCSVAASFIQNGVFDKVLVVGSEAMSRWTDFKDRNTCVLFGDGAGAVILSRTEEGRGLLGQRLGADGSGKDLLMIPAGGSMQPVTCEVIESRSQYIQMNGNEVYKFATRIIPAVIEEALDGTNMVPGDLDLIIPHQANVRILEVAARKLGVPMSRFVVNIEKYGNTSAATVPLAMMDARNDNRLQTGTAFALVAFGAGLTYGASIWKW